MSKPISSIRNLGPATEAHFAKAGITTAEELYELGAHEAYRRWLQAALPAHFIGYYALVMALQGRPWNACKGDEKKALRAKFDGLVREAAGSSERLWSDLDAALDAIGVVAKR